MKTTQIASWEGPDRSDLVCSYLGCWAVVTSNRLNSYDKFKCKKCTVCSLVCKPTLHVNNIILDKTVWEGGQERRESVCEQTHLQARVHKHRQSWPRKARTKSILLFLLGVEGVKEPFCFARDPHCKHGMYTSPQIRTKQRH